MKILSRKSSAATKTSRKEQPGSRAPRRIEITVEREIVSVRVPGRPPDEPADSERRNQAAERPLLEMPRSG